MSEFRQWGRSQLGQLDISTHKTLLYLAVWLSAGIVGAAAVMYARLIAHFQSVFFAKLQAYPIWVTLAAPILFLIATWLVVKFAPQAKGSGIPQVLEAIEQARHSTEGDVVWSSPLVSLRTAVFKIISSCVGILGGASIGREGPTVQIAASGFVWVGKRIRKFAPQIDLQTFLIAGGAAGVAAAFTINTPIAGITFALEEIAGGVFGTFMQVVMLAIIISGVIAQGLVGNYLYFGEPAILKSSVGLLIVEALGIGLLGGVLGGFFAKILAEPKVTRLPKHWAVRALVAGVICSLLGYFTHGDTSGSGYEVARKALSSSDMTGVSVLFPVYKLVTTILSYLSGMAGGIFSPCLSIGAGLGLSVAKLMGLENFKTCALIGMVGFFSGAVRAPLTAVIIVMEMTNEHILVLPFMISAYLAQSVGKRIMPTSLYHYLAEKELKG